jgi:copper chaperone
MSNITYLVPNISCMHCVHTIKTELSDLKGVKSVEADLATKKVSVVFESPATPAELEKVLIEIEYPPVK